MSDSENPQYYMDNLQTLDGLADYPYAGKGSLETGN